MALRRVFNAAIEQGAIEHVPVRIDMPRRVRKAVVAYDAPEQAALLDAAKVLGHRYMVMLLLGIDAGLRRGEMLALQRTDLDLAHGCLVVRHNLVRGKVDLPKGRSEDEISLTPRVIEALRVHRHKDGPFVFSTGRGTHFVESDIARWMRKLVDLAAVPWHGTHILRRTCGTRIANGGGGVAAIAGHLRHKDLQTASRYIDRRGASSRALCAGELMEARSHPP